MDPFNNLPGPENEAEVSAPAIEDNGKVKNAEKKAEIEEMKAIFREHATKDPSLLTRLGSRSNDIVVVKSLAFGDSGNIAEDKTPGVEKVVGKNGKARPPLVPTAAIVGYKIQNVSQEPVSYQKRVWAADAEGIFSDQTVTRVLNPGEAADLSRADLALLGRAVEFSLQLSNGIITRSSGRRNTDDIQALLESFHFVFSEKDGRRPSVHDDDIKVNVGKKVGDKWVVKKEFEETFGYLNNPQSRAKKERGARVGSGRKITSADLVAAKLRELCGD